MTRLLMTVLTFCVAMAAGAVQLSDKQRDAIAERIKPVGEVCLQGDSSCLAGAASGAASSAADQTASTDQARSGEEVYNAACMACHATGAAGAPVTGNAASWADRITKGLDVLYESGIKGVPGTGMMAKGGCMNCSDEEVMAAVDFMVEKSQ